MTYLAGELPQRRTTDARYYIFENGIRDALDNCLDVFILLLHTDVAMLGGDQVSGILEGVLNDVVELLVL